MTLDQLMSQLTGRHRETALEAQLRELRREIRRVGQSIAHRAGHASEDWGDHRSDLSHQVAKRGAHLAEKVSSRGTELAEVAAYQAGRGAKAFRKDPLPAIAIVGTALLVASLFRRR